ncbi:MAG: hypothetical protein V3V61_06795 [Gammaproteobacteria bacterium]
MSHLKAQGALILSELNDLKRTVGSCATELDWDKNEVERIVKGDAHQDLVNKFIDAFAAFYPVNKSNLILCESDCENGVKIFTLEQSRVSARVFDRKDHQARYTPYYEYCDTATSALSAYRPEWIKQLRVVEDNDPYNLDVAYNNGHLMHQVTFFVGPVNFYYMHDGKKVCEVMNTGDSNYITPFCPHSFTTRNSDEEAYIIAVTFGANVKRAIEELYHLGASRSGKYIIDTCDPAQGVQDLLDYHLNNARKNRHTLQEWMDQAEIKINVLDRQYQLDEEAIKVIAEMLNLNITDFMFSVASSEDEVIIKKTVSSEAYVYPAPSDPKYKIWPLAGTKKLPLVRASRIEILQQECAFSPDFSLGLHTYLFNYGDYPCGFVWKYNDEIHTVILNPGDSIYVQPFVEHLFYKVSTEVPQIFSVGIPGAISFEVQKELSNLKDINRTVFETQCWFN